MIPLSKTEQVVGLVGWLAVSFAAAGIGAVASINAASFYGQLVQPGWAPPASVFGPVWTILYALMGIAAWLAWREGGGSHCACSAYLILAAAHGKCTMELALLCLASRRFGIRQYRTALVTYRCYADIFLADTSSCGCSPYSLLVVGQFCFCTQLVRVAAQSTDSGIKVIA